MIVPQMRRVMFLGAGASVPFDIPPTAKILPRAVMRLRTAGKPGLFCGQNGRGPDEIEDELLFEEGLRTLYLGINLSADEDQLTAALPNITEALSFLDYLILNEQPIKPRWDRDKVIRLRRIFDRAICEVLSTRFAPMSGAHRPDGDGIEPESTDPYLNEPLWNALQAYLYSQLHYSADHLTVITTNYDLTLDNVLAHIVDASRRGLTKIDLGFEFRDVRGTHLVSRPSASPMLQATDKSGNSGPVAGRLALYKLHGSLNYLRCEICDQIYVNPNGNIAYLAFDRDPKPENTCQCGHGPLRHVIVAPSMVRSYRIPQILSTWAAATEALRLADEWTFIGYSLPQEDLAIRSMLFRTMHARGQIANSKKRIDQWEYRAGPKITVVQNSDRARPAYNLLFGDIDYSSSGFESWLMHSTRQTVR